MGSKWTKEVEQRRPVGGCSVRGVEGHRWYNGTSDLIVSFDDSGPTLQCRRLRRTDSNGDSCPDSLVVMVEATATMLPGRQWIAVECWRSQQQNDNPVPLLVMTSSL